MRPREKLPSLDDQAIVRNSAYNVLGTGLPVLLGLIAVPVTIRLMGLERFALLSLLWAALKLVSAPGAGYTGALVRNVSHALGAGAAAERLVSIIRTCFLLQLLVILPAAALLWAGAGPLAEKFFGFGGALAAEAKFVFRAAALILPVYSSAALFSSILAAHQRFRALNLVKVLFESLFLCLPPAIFYYGGGFRELAAAFFAGQLLLAAVWLLLMRRRGLLRGLLAPSVQGAGGLTSYAAWLALAKGAAMGSEESSRLITGAVCGPASLALYNVPHEIYTALAILPQSFVSALLPAYSAACASEERGRLDAYFYGYAAKLLLLTSLAFSGLVLFAPEILLLVTGTEQPASAVLALQFFGIAEMAAGTNYMAAGWFNGRNNPRVPARIQAFSLVLFLPAAWLAARAFGVPGAAGAMLFKILLENALYIGAAEKAGASAGRAFFAGTAAGSAALAGAAFVLCGAIDQASLLKTVSFLAAIAVSGALAFSARGFFLLPQEGRA